MLYKVLTANRLKDGRVVYLAEDDRWTSDIGLARRAFDDADAVRLEDLGKAAAGNNQVADPYLIDLDDDRPQRWRESIRAGGPTIRPDLGYQAGQEA